MENTTPGMTNPYPTGQSPSWFKRPWNILGLILIMIATFFIIGSYVGAPAPSDKPHVCNCNQVEAPGFKFDSIWILFIAGALFMDTPLRGFISRIRGNSSQSVPSTAPETVAQQQANKDA